MLYQALLQGFIEAFRVRFPGICCRASRFVVLLEYGEGVCNPFLCRCSGKILASERGYKPLLHIRMRLRDSTNPSARQYNSQERVIFTIWVSVMGTQNRNPDRITWLENPSGSIPRPSRYRCASGLKPPEHSGDIRVVYASP
jgi:hypothetical protein